MFAVPASRFVRSADVIYARIDDGESVMLSIDAGKYYGLNAVASRVLELLEAPQATASICARILEEFDVDAAVCKRDMIKYIEVLLANGVIRAVAPSDV
jgi:hypothetical protein